MGFEALRTELETDPLARGYSGMTDADVVTNMNTVDRTRNRTTMSGAEVKKAFDLDATTRSEWAALSADAKSHILALCSRDDLDPFGVDSMIFQDVASTATNTIAELLNARVENISRAQEIGYENGIDVSAVQSARS